MSSYIQNEHTLETFVCINVKNDFLITVINVTTKLCGWVNYDLHQRLHITHG